MEQAGSWGLSALLFGRGDKQTARAASTELVAGVGSPHTPVGHIWPMAVVIEALTDSS